MLKFVNKLFGSSSKNKLKSYYKTIETINGLEKEISLLSDEDLQKKTNFYKEKIEKGSTLNQILPEVFAVVREVAHRTIGLRHFDVQLLGGIVLHEGMIAEMKTGEGKTLVATLAAYLNSLSGDKVHITVSYTHLRAHET